MLRKCKMEIKIEKMNMQELSKINIDDFDDFWNANILENDLKLDTSYYIVAKGENEVLGFAGLNFVLDEASISNIAVRKDMRNQKIGSKLLLELINKAKEKSSLITLEVNIKNTVAIHLYEKYGFKVIRYKKKIL